MLVAQHLFGLVPGLILLILGAWGAKFPGWTVKPTPLIRSILAGLGVAMIAADLFVR
jgi:hypothetical protein